MNRIKNYIIGVAILIVIVLILMAWFKPPILINEPIHDIQIDHGLILDDIEIIDIGNNISISNIETHAYTTIEKKEDVFQLDEMVTYVLFPRVAKTVKVEERYQNLLNSIMRKSDRMLLEHNLTLKELKRINRFIITVKSLDTETNLSNYNYKLSKEILDYFRKKLGYKLFKGEGPYLITTRSKVFTQNEIENILYLNLEKFDESAIVETVKIYMNRLEDNETIKFSLLDELKFTILDHMVDLNNGVEKIVQVFNPTPVHASE